MSKKRFLGLQYPIIKTARGLFAQKTGIDQIKADLLQLLLTNPGERIMMPDYGTPLRDLLFEPNDAILENIAREMITTAILKWEPRIVVTNIEVSSQVSRSKLNPQDLVEDLDNILYIKIQFADPENIQEIEELKLARSLGG